MKMNKRTNAGKRVSIGKQDLNLRQHAPPEVSEGFFFIFITIPLFAILLITSNMFLIEFTLF